MQNTLLYQPGMQGSSRCRSCFQEILHFQSFIQNIYAINRVCKVLSVTSCVYRVLDASNLVHIKFYATNRVCMYFTLPVMDTHKEVYDITNCVNMELYFISYAYRVLCRFFIKWHCCGQIFGNRLNFEVDA